MFLLNAILFNISIFKFITNDKKTMFFIKIFISALAFSFFSAEESECDEAAFVVEREKDQSEGEF